MAIVIWDGSLATGIKLIDLQHKRLFEIINQLHDKMHDAADEMSLLTTFDSMSQYARIHFQSEESLLEKYKYHDIDIQKAEHNEFYGEIESLKEEFHKNGISNLFSESLTYLLNWVVRHVETHDLKFAEFIRLKIAEDESTQG
ncbi:MAG: bacteriohemerythrin [Leptospirales bacterium]